MSQKKLVAFINAENEYPANIIKLADKYSCDGADGLFIYNYSGDEASREEFLLTVRKIEKQIDIPDKDEHPSDQHRLQRGQYPRGGNKLPP